jgi:hypothetical protein
MFSAKARADSTTWYAPESALIPTTTRGGARADWNAGIDIGEAAEYGAVMDEPYQPPRGPVLPEPEEPEHPVAGPLPEPPRIPDNDRFVTVYSTQDVVLAEMLDQMLRAEGIPTPTFRRNGGAHLGGGALLIDQLIRVPSSQKEQARELIDAFVQGTPNELDEVDDDLPPQPTRSRSGLRSFLLYVAFPVLAAFLFAALVRR